MRVEKVGVPVTVRLLSITAERPIVSPPARVEVAVEEVAVKAANVGVPVAVSVVAVSHEVSIPVVPPVIVASQSVPVE